MSKLKVAALQGLSASSDAITLANDGTCTANITNNLSNRNIIINGAMQIAQRGTSFSAPADGYTLDRWSVYENLSTAQVAVTQETVTDLVGFTKAAKINCTTAEAGVPSASGNQYATYIHAIEAQNLTHIGNGTSAAKPLICSFYVKSNVTGTFAVSFYKPDNTARLISLPYTINSANTWERKTLSIPADTSGGGINNDNGFGIGAYFILARKTGYTGTTSTSWINYTDSGWAPTCTASIFENVNDHMFITGVQLEVDNTGSGVATDFEHRSYADELLRCKRYYVEMGRVFSGESGYVLNGLQAYTTNDLFGTLAQLPVTMRARPTCTVAGSITFSDKAGSNTHAPSSTLTVNQSSPNWIGVSGASFGSAHFIQGGFAFTYCTPDGTNYVKVDAEI